MGEVELNQLKFQHSKLHCPIRTTWRKRVLCVFLSRERHPVLGCHGCHLALACSRVLGMEQGKLEQINVISRQQLLPSSRGHAC